VGAGVPVTPVMRRVGLDELTVLMKENPELVKLISEFAVLE
jgi:hypothetical protein